ncbi:lipase member N-like isoform X1 [Amblyomma americanum]
MRVLPELPTVILLCVFSVLGRFHFDSDSLRNASGLIVSKGYPVEDHTAVTEDGYLLGMQRIPYGRNETAVLGSGQKKPVVLVIHAAAVSSADFVINFPEQSLGFLLADAGYDVWLGNLRGNVYTSHVRYTKRERAFWDFSFDQMIEFDVPAMIDTALGTTNQTKLYYVGLSQGTQVLFGLLAEKPNYNDKIALFMAMGPIAYIGHMTANVVLLIPFADLIVTFVQLTTSGGVLQINWETVLSAITLCGDDMTIAVCLEFVEIANGIDWNQLNVTRVAVYFTHSPAGTSIANLYHFAQIYRCNCFRKYDYGFLKNLIKYGSLQPPTYDMTLVRAPVGLYYSNSDVYSVPEDVARLESELPNVVRSYLVPEEEFTHYDFALGIHAADMVYRDMLQLMEQYPNQ